MPIHTVPGTWLEAERLETIATNRTGATLSKGDIVAFDLTGSDGDVDAYGTTSTDPLANVISAATAHLKGWIFAVALESIADDAKGRFLVRGVDEVELADSDTSDVAAGKTFTATNGQTYASLRTDGAVSLGIALESAVSTGAAVKTCYFNGIAMPAAGAAS